MSWPRWCADEDVDEDHVDVDLGDESGDDDEAASVT
jgi:hypothetical protein